MTWRVSGSVMPFPTLEARRLAPWLKRANARAQVAGRDVEKAADCREKPADGRIERRILQSPGEEGHFDRMSEDGYIPQIRQLRCAACMIHVSVGEQNRFRPRAGAVNGFCRLANLLRAARDSRIDENPRCAGRSCQINIRDAYRNLEDSGCYLVGLHKLILAARQ